MSQSPESKTSRQLADEAGEQIGLARGILYACKMAHRTNEEIEAAHVEQCMDAAMTCLSDAWAALDDIPGDSADAESVATQSFAN